MQGTCRKHGTRRRTLREHRTRAWTLRTCNMQKNMEHIGRHSENMEHMAGHSENMEYLIRHTESAEHSGRHRTQNTQRHSENMEHTINRSTQVDTQRTRDGGGRSGPRGARVDTGVRSVFACVCPLWGMWESHVNRVPLGVSPHQAARGMQSTVTPALRVVSVSQSRRSCCPCLTLGVDTAFLFEATPWHCGSPTGTTAERSRGACTRPEMEHLQGHSCPQSWP